MAYPSYSAIPVKELILSNRPNPFIKGRGLCYWVIKRDSHLNHKETFRIVISYEYFD